MESMNLSPHGRSGLGAIPSLDGLLADPAAFKLLPTDTQNAVYAQVAALEAAFRATILTRGRDGSAPATSEPGRAVRIEEAMSRFAEGPQVDDTAVIVVERLVRQALEEHRAAHDLAKKIIG